MADKLFTTTLRLRLTIALITRFCQDITPKQIPDLAIQTEVVLFLIIVVLLFIVFFP